MISALKVSVLTVNIFLCACNPLSQNDTLKDSRVQGVELVAGGYAPQDHWAGQWRMINIWTEWCKPCWQEMPELNQFFAAQGDTDVKLLGFNFDELERHELMIIKEKMSIEFPILAQWPNAWRKPDIKGLPATLIVSPDNQTITILWGPQSVSSLYAGLEEAKKVMKNRLKES